MQRAASHGRTPWLSYGLVLASLLITAGIFHDAWWHITYGRDTFWSPPHLLIYAGLAGMVLLFLRERAIVPWPAWLFAALIFLASPVDNWWHAFFGKEAVNSIGVVWSPPHLITELALLGLFLIVARQLLRQRAAGAFTLQWTAVTGIVLFILNPLMLLGAFRVLGAWGSLIPLFAFGVLIASYLAVRKGALLPYLAVTALLMLPVNIHRASPAAGFPVFHAHLDLFWFVLLFFIPVIAVDAFARRKSPAFRTALYLTLNAVVYTGGHALLIAGYRELWPAILMEAVLAWPVGLLAAQVSRYVVRLVRPAR